MTTTPTGWRVAHPVGVKAVEYEVERKALNAAIDSVGIPKADEVVSYTDDGDLNAQLLARRARLMAQGISQARVGEAIQLRPAFDALAKRSVESVRHIREAVLQMIPGNASRRDRIEALAGFVQSFDNTAPTRYRSDSGGRTLMTAGIRHPLETVYTGQGDCDSLSVLFSALLHSVAESDRIFLAGMVEGERHLMVGVELTPREGDLFIQNAGARWVVFDLTQGSHGSAVSARGKALIRGKQFEIIDAN